MINLLDDEAEALELSSLSIGDTSALDRGLRPIELPAENGERVALGLVDGPAENCIGIAGTGSPWSNRLSSMTFAKP